MINFYIYIYTNLRNNKIKIKIYVCSVFKIKIIKSNNKIDYEYYINHMNIE